MDTILNYCDLYRPQKYLHGPPVKNLSFRISHISSPVLSCRDKQYDTFNEFIRNQNITNVIF